MPDLTNRLTIEDVEAAIRHEDRRGRASHVYKQLLATMQENDENCRLLGMSAERELALRAENERLRKALQEIAGQTLHNTNNRYEILLAKKALSNEVSDA